MAASMSEMVDRVETAIKACRNKLVPPTDAELALAAIAAMRTPTEAMVRAGRSQITDQHPDLTWPAMIDEALKERLEPAMPS